MNAMNIYMSLGYDYSPADKIAFEVHSGIIQDPQITSLLEQAKVNYELKKCSRCGWVHLNLLQQLLCKLTKKKKP